MAKLTLLEIVQDILNDMDSDEVNSIDDTVESQQVAQIVKSCYFEMISNRNWPHLQKLIQLEHSGDLSKPNYLKVPERLKELSKFKYETTNSSNGTIAYKDVYYCYPDEFLDLVQGKQVSNDDVTTVTDFNGTRLYINKTRDPRYWTSFDDNYIVTDSYNSLVDDTLKKDKTQAIAYIEPQWLSEDDFVPDLPSEAFSALLEESKSTAFLALKQTANQKAEQKANRQNRWLSRKAWKTHGGVRYPDFGRKSRK